MKKEMLVVPIPAFLVVIFLFPLSLVTAAVEEDTHSMSDTCAACISMHFEEHCISRGIEADQCTYFGLTEKQYALCVKKKAFAVKGPPIYNDDTPPSYNETAFEFHNARKCVAVIVELYRAICTKAGAADACEAATRILRGGATGCHKDSTMGAWNSVRNCLKKYR